MTIERISNEINSSICKGREYVTQTVGGTLGAVKAIATSIGGEAQLQYREGRWVPRTVKPGIKHLIRAIR